MSFLDSKAPPGARSQGIAFRPTEDQDHFLRSIGGPRGSGKPSLSSWLSEFVDLYRDLSNELGEDGIRRLKAKIVLENVSLGTYLGRLAKAALKK